MKRLNGNTRMAAGLLLVGWIGTMAAIHIGMPDRAFSDSENRVLEQRPRFSANALLSGRYIRDYTSYIADQFAFRDVWVGVKTDADRALGKKESNGVFLGKDGYLLERYESPEESELQEKAEALRRFDEALPGMRKYVLLAPTAASLLSDKLPPFAPVGDQRADLEHFRGLLPKDTDWVEVADAMRKGSEGGEPFYRTDHHWTTAAAYSAYRELIADMGLVPQRQEAFEIRTASDEFYGSLFSKSGFRHLTPDLIEIYAAKSKMPVKVSYMEEGRTEHSLYAEKRLAEKDKYAVFLDGNHSWIRIETGSPTGRSLLIVKDSYANSLIPFLVGHFTRIDVIDLRYYDKPLIRLAREQKYEDMLLLYNAKTFFEDSSILNITEGTP